MAKEQQQDTRAIQPGMMVEATSGDLGEDDVTKPRVTEVERGTDGSVKKMKVQKGLFFKKVLEIPGDRIQEIVTSPQTGNAGNVLNSLIINRSRLQPMLPRRWCRFSDLLREYSLLLA